MTLTCRQMKKKLILSNEALRVNAVIFLLHKIRERKVKTLTKNWRNHCRTCTQKHKETYTYIRSLLISERQPCPLKYSVCFCVSVLQWSLQFLVRVFTFLSLILYYSYFGTFISTWSIFSLNLIVINKMYADINLYVFQINSVLICQDSSGGYCMFYINLI